MNSKLLKNKTIVINNQLTSFNKYEDIVFESYLDPRHLIDPKFLFVRSGNIEKDFILDEFISAAFSQLRDFDNSKISDTFIDNIILLQSMTTSEVQEKFNYWLCSKDTKIFESYMHELFGNNQYMTFEVDFSTVSEAAYILEHQKLDDSEECIGSFIFIKEKKIFLIYFIEY